MRSFVSHARPATHQHSLPPPPNLPTSSLPIRLRAKIKLQSSTAGALWDSFQVMLSLAACVLYVVSTFDIGERVTEIVIELVFAFFFSLDLCLNFFIADNRIRY